MPIKILATGDLHLGRRSSGIPAGNDHGSPSTTWELMVDLAIRDQVDVVALLGDIADRDNRYFEAIGPLIRGFTKLNEHSIQVVMISGNHDYDVPRQIATTTGLENVRLLGQGGRWELLPFSKGDQSLHFAGWSFPEEHVRYSPLNSFDILKQDTNVPLIGLLHCDIGVQDSPYAPVMLNELISKQADAWLLGHIHKPTELNRSAPLIWYTGSPHAFSAKETGEHGPLIVTIHDNNSISASARPLSPIRYESIRITIDDNMDRSALRPAAMKTLYDDAGQRRLESEHLKHMVYDIYLEGTFKQVDELDVLFREMPEENFNSPHNDLSFNVRKVINNVMPAIGQLEELAGSATPAGMLAETILAIRQGQSTPFLEGLINGWKRRHQDLQSSGTYIPLMKHPIHAQDPDTMAREYILKECNRLISALIAQQP